MGDVGFRWAQSRDLGRRLITGNAFCMQIQLAATLGFQRPYCPVLGVRGGEIGACLRFLGSLVSQALKPTLGGLAGIITGFWAAAVSAKH